MMNETCVFTLFLRGFKGGKTQAADFVISLTGVFILAVLFQHVG
ncbi:hypothetical protein B4123_4335 [Bacillus paralicheniformis]|uniref:Uncharacterized protein n=1 Tax=Bacillus paralicheniformis TaxID=1648923 RepID=A0A6N2EZG0_9BACI|nr:hypothetical protein LI7559_15475 [Bacillus licheniformis LMG 7559]KUL15141.1 hypothetical protein LI6934_21475 [Bacillus licheniformis LMG 6934]OLF92760.1 hypothetical protein B4121_2448 [Bacillus paralicheniformis]OLG02961.1 hypothetical protein B4123_4335 [Bacillus paralicheniformis]TWJ58012.1 hypothetical protein CHCC5023_1333 [Bacillus paralicheniformis]